MCSTCLEFKEHFISLAKTMNHKAKKHIPFYAMSCAAHPTLCQLNKVDSLPSVKAYRGASVDGITLNTFDDPDQIVSSLNNIDAKLVLYHLDKDNQTPKKQKQLLKSNNTSQITRQKNVFLDAGLSFTFSLNGVFMENGALASVRQTALTDWLSLLHSTLPPQLKVHHIISSLLQNMDTIVTDEKNLSALLSKDPLPQTKWSTDCTKSNEYAGYTCGLWELFHIMSIGVVEWNKNGRDRISTLHAGDVHREFIANFFSCEVCQLHFLKMYDECSFGRCDRLTEEASSLTEWREFPLWLWEMHNDVNVRLMKEEAERTGREVTLEDEDNARWPSKESCLDCWHGDRTWDEDAVYDFLSKEYWPNASVSPHFAEDTKASEDATLASKNTVLHQNFAKSTKELNNKMITFIMGAVLPVALICGYWKKRMLASSGRHKKGF